MRQRVLVIGASGQVGRETCAVCTVELRGSCSRIAGVRHPQCGISGEGICSHPAGSRRQRRAYTAVDKRNRTGISFRDKCEWCRERGPRLQPSCDAVDSLVDGLRVRRTTHFGLSRGDPTNPINVYGESKLAGERQIHDARIPPDPPSLLGYGVAGSNFVKTMLRLVVRTWSGWSTTSSGRRVRRPTLQMRYGATPLEATYAKAARTPLFVSPQRHGLVLPRRYSKPLRPRMVRHVPRLDPITTDQYPTSARRPSNSILDSSELQRIMARTRRIGALRCVAF